MRLSSSVKWDLVFDSSSDGPFTVHTNLNRNVSLLRIFPGITYLTMRQFLEPPIQGIVLQTYGAGNLPTNRPDLIDELRKATERGVLIINCTQCAKGTVNYVYESATSLQKAGVCSGSDMTIEAALMKVRRRPLTRDMPSRLLCSLVILSTRQRHVRHEDNEVETERKSSR
jgi:60kDa lysophospholipase